jgi:sulfate adenylyltransferase subunit 1 (EFTu-like GTPase family)
VAARGVRTPWYEGPSLLEYLETVEVEPAGSAARCVSRCSWRFGRTWISAATPGRLLPAASAWEIVWWRCPRAWKRRGDMLADPYTLPAVSREFAATLIWMAAEPLRPEAAYLLKHTTRQVCANVRSVRHVVDLRTLDPGPAAEPKLKVRASIGDFVEVYVT